MALKKKKLTALDIEIWGGILSYPDLANPKPGDDGKVQYRTDVLLDHDDAQVEELKEKIDRVKRAKWGDDESEWPEQDYELIKNGDDRKDESKTYKGKWYLSLKTATPITVIDQRDKDFNPQLVRGGQTANVLARISCWKFKGKEGVSIYLQGVQIDTSVPTQKGFGGGPTKDQIVSRFKKKGTNRDTDEEDTGDDDEDDRPRKSKTKKQSRAFDDEEEDDQPRSKKRARDDEE